MPHGASEVIVMLAEEVGFVAAERAHLPVLRANGTIERTTDASLL
jgi:hypothetical protein